MANLPSDIYEVRLYDHDFNLIGLLQGWSRLEYHQRINSPWNHLIEWRFGAEDTQRIAELSVLVPDMPILIYRGNVETGAWNRVYEGFHLTTVDQQTKNGDYIITLYGSGFTDLLNRRIVIPPANSENRTYSGNADYVMKSFVIDACTQPKPPEESPYDTDRIMPNLTVLPFTGEGGTVEYSARYTNLLTILENMADEGNMRFGIVGNDHPFNGFTFVCKPIWGSDRRINSSNPNKGTPILFSPELDNMEIPILSRNYSDEKNVVYVGGQGVGTERMILELTDVDAEALTPWSRKEAFSDSRGEGTMDGMLTAGKRYLEEYSARTSLTFNVRQTPGCQWIRDWNVGDIITAKYRDYLVTEEITEVSVYVTFSDSAELIERVDVELKDLTAGMRNYLAEWTLPYYNPTPEPNYNILPSGLNQLAVFGYQYFDEEPYTVPFVAITSDFQTPASEGGPTWTVYSHTAYGTQFAVDAFSYATGIINGWILGPGGVWRIDDIFNTRSLSQLISSSNLRSIDASFIQPGLVVISGHDSNGSYVRVSTDGTTFSPPRYITNIAQSGDVKLSQHTAGKIFTSAKTSGEGKAHGYISLNYGETWEISSDPLFSNTGSVSHAIHVPYNDNENEKIVYWIDPQEGLSSGLYIRKVNGTTQTLIDIITHSGIFVTMQGRWTMDSCPINRQRFVHVDSTTENKWHVDFSEDGGDTTSRSTNGTPNIYCAAISGDNEDVVYLGGAGYVGYTNNFGVTVDDRRGNLPYNCNVYGFCGGTF